jgi:hypothetical protein
MVKRSCLPPTFGILEDSSESAFPARDPIIEGNRSLVRSGEKMYMVGHNDVSAYDPRIVAEPGDTKRTMHFRSSQPWLPFPCASGRKDQGRDGFVFENSFCRPLSLRIKHSETMYLYLWDSSLSIPSAAVRTAQTRRESHHKGGDAFRAPRFSPYRLGAFRHRLP